MPERRKPKPESKGRLLGSWIDTEGMDILHNSSGTYTYYFSNDSETYSKEHLFQTKERFSESEIRQAAVKLNELGALRYAKSKVSSYVNKDSVGGYQWSSSGPVSSWSSGESAGFQVDGINIQLRPKENDW